MTRPKSKNIKNRSGRYKTASVPPSIAKKSTKKLVKPTVFRPRIKFLLEISKIRLLDELRIEFFERGARGNSVESSSQRRSTMGYRGLLFSDAMVVMIHAKRVILVSKDLHLAIPMRGYDKVILDR